MLTKKNKLLLILLLFFSLESCEKKIQFDDETVAISQINYQGNAILLDSSIVINCIIYNKSKDEIFIPVSSWFYNGKRKENDGHFARPDEPYFINTVHYYPKESNLNNAIFDMDLFSFYEKWPFFLKIDPKSEKSLKLFLSMYYIGNNGQILSRFEEKYVYSILIGLPLFTKNNLLKIIDEKFDFTYLIKDNLSIVIPNQLFNKPGYMYKETNFLLNRLDCEYLNLLSENRLIMKFEVNL